MVKTKNLRGKINRGFTLVEVLITIFVASVLVLAIFNMFDYVMKIITTNKARIGAISLANEKMELIRNLPYNSVGIENSSPPGSIAQTEQITRNGVAYTVSTQIFYIDDPFDGIVDEIPDDLSGGNDYKRVSVSVGWQGYLGNSVSVISYIAPKGIETNLGGGTLYITVFNANGNPVSGADVHIENSNVDPEILINTQTDSEGHVILPGSPTSTESYKIVVTKTGYSTDQTYDRTIQNPNPVKPHASVFANQKTEISFAIDLVGNLTIYTMRQALPDNWKINTDDSNAAHYNPTMEIDSLGNMYFGWEDYRDSSSPRIYSQKYKTDKTPTWDPDSRVSTAVNQVNPDIAIDSQNNIYYGWNDDVNGNQDIFLIKQDANGNDLWSGSKKIDTGANSSDQILPIIDVDNADNCYVVWQDQRNGCGDIYLHKISPAGNNVWAAEVKASSEAPGSCQINPYLKIDSDNNVYVGWTDNRDGNQDIYAQKFDSAGNKLWTNDLKVNTDSGTANQNFPSFDFDATGNIYFSWTDWRDGNQDIYAQKYNPDGANLWSSDIKINTDGADTEQYYSSIVVSGNFVYFVWTDERQGNRDIYAQKYNLDGEKQWDPDLRVNVDNTDTDQYSANLAVDSSGTVYVAWQDNRDDNFNIYAAKFEAAQDVSYVGNVPLAITGAKLIGADPDIHKYSDDSFSTDSNGRLLLNNMEWDLYTVTTTDGYTIKLSNPVQPINLLPNSSQTVYLNLN